MNTIDFRLAGKRVLLVEPDLEICAAIEDALIGAGAARAIVVHTAAEAIAALKTTALDAALLNGSLPDETADIAAYWLDQHGIPFACIANPMEAPANDVMEPRSRRDAPVDRNAVVNIARQLVINGAQRRPFAASHQRPLKADRFKV